ncbi:hypothetical protein [Streptomyces graminilatus]|uniref:hypothetical protein n=1 Tax=Streptomyces graminilatus TaxID=1464070 RepID=UPI0006E1372E|nr:hypothetical protein [Streptomyces graminilatus]
MPSSHKVTLRPVPGTELPEVEFTFGSSFPGSRERMIKEGFGFEIELPAVLDLLTAIDNGELKAGDLRDVLLRAVGAMYARADCWRYEDDEDKLAWCRRDGTCQTCARHHTAFANSLTQAAERWRRWTLPEHYPYAAGSANGLHEVGCPVLRRDMPQQFNPPAADNAEALRAFAHRADAYDQPPMDLLPLTYSIPFHAMTAGETRSWMERNTGPRGGRHYHRCERCAPAP